MKILTKKEPMNKAIVVSLSLLTMLMIASCGKESSNEPQIPNPTVPTIIHKYEVTSSGPVELSFIASPLPGDPISITVNGRDVPLGLTFNHSGSASYNISSETRLLISRLWFCNQEATGIEITCKWIEYQNGKETKSDTQKLSLQPYDWRWLEDYETDLR